MVIVETPLFTERIAALATDDDYAAFQVSLIRHPGQGDLIKGGGGIRKTRLRLSGRGKSAGARVIYYWLVKAGQIYMLVACAKSARTDLSAQQVKILKDLVKELD